MYLSESIISRQCSPCSSLLESCCTLRMLLLILHMMYQLSSKSALSTLCIVDFADCLGTWLM